MRSATVTMREPVFCVPDTTVERVAQLMAINDIELLPVVDSEETKRLVGVVTDRDLALRVVAAGRDPGTARVREVMSKSIIASDAGDDPAEVEKLMELWTVRRVPVIEKDMHLVGIMTQKVIPS